MVIFCFEPVDFSWGTLQKSCKIPKDIQDLIWESIWEHKSRTPTILVLDYRFKGFFFHKQSTF
jgi:hypothetical protein